MIEVTHFYLHFNIGDLATGYGDYKYRDKNEADAQKNFQIH